MKVKAPFVVKALFIAVIIMANVGCDQLSKHIAREKLSPYQTIGLVYDHFTLTKVENTGAFLSLGTNIPGPIKFVLLSLLPLIVIAGSIVFIITKKDLDRITLIAACFIIGGGIGNIYDRLLYGSVTDFMHIGFGAVQTGIFNMADVSVMIGVFTLAGNYYIKDRRAKKMQEA